MHFAIDVAKKDALELIKLINEHSFSGCILILTNGAGEGGR